jgi:antitoxin (DNA-binding transcriptional repressor) of toxin-antitoxin stability system
MQRSVSAREANQQFSRMLREVESGTEIMVTRRRIVPVPASPERQLA